VISPGPAVDRPVAQGATAGRARLLYVTGRGRRSVVVDYHRLGESLTVHLPEFNDAVRYVNGSLVTVELEEPAGGSRSTRLRGRAEVVPAEAVPPGAAASLEQWPTGVCSRYLQIIPQLRDRAV
jgi:hypothetical protein